VGVGIGDRAGHDVLHPPDSGLLIKVLSRDRRYPSRNRPGFTLLAVLVVFLFAIAVAAAVVVVNSAASAEQTRVERAQAFFTDITRAGRGLPLFIADLGDPPGRLSDLGTLITTSGSNVCGKAYSNGDVGSWTARYVDRLFPATGTPAGIGIVSDTLLYEEVSGVGRAVVMFRSVPEQEAIRLDARVDTAAGTSGSTAGVVRWNIPDASGLVTLKWSYPLAHKCTGGNVSPTASFTYVCTAFSCAFTDGSTDSDGTISSWAWSFGDATTSTQQNPSKTFSAAGTYTVSLTVTDNQLGEGSVSQSVSVSNIILSGSGRKVGGNRFADLTWSGATSLNVDIYRDDVLIVTTANDGAYTDAISNSTFIYKVCEQGTAICSNTVSVTPP
jgi:type II secretory pathway pseudopilin PulG